MIFEDGSHIVVEHIYEFVLSKKMCDRKHNNCNYEVICVMIQLNISLEKRK